jgi:pantoate--beta-alanine ligase
MRAAARVWRREGLRIAFVPTMGYLHAGHRRLLEEGRARGDRLVLSVFVNPTQFGPGEDFERYPRDLARDAGLAEAAGADVLFAPTVAEMYPDGESATRVSVPGLAGKLCGRSRPGHFDGVATVVAKLFHVVTPDVALFGEKDYQQLTLIRRMVRDLGFDIEIAGVETVRETDGLAMSSRNVYLAAEDRDAARSLSRGIAAARELASSGERSAATIAARVRQVISVHPQNAIDYVEIVDPDTLDPVSVLEESARLILAVRVGGTRLIDNARIEVQTPMRGLRDAKPRHGPAGR